MSGLARDRRRHGLAAAQPRGRARPRRIAWIVFRENVDRRMFLGHGRDRRRRRAAVVARATAARPRSGALLIAGACLALGDRQQPDPQACPAATRCRSPRSRALVAGAINLGARAGSGRRAAARRHAGVGAGCVGFLGYGISLVLFVLAAAPPRHRAHRRLFLASRRSSARRSRSCCSASRAGPLFWIAGGADGARRVAAPDASATSTSTRTRRWSTTHRARPRRAPPARARSPWDGERAAHAPASSRAAARTRTRTTRTCTTATTTVRR